MIAKLRTIRQEFRPMLQLAWPLVLAELGWMSMGIVDTMMVGRLPASAVAIGAVSLGGVVFYTVAFFGSGLLLGLDTLVSQAFGAEQVDDCHHSLVNSVFLSLALTPLLMGFIWVAIPLLRTCGARPEVLREAVPYLKAMNWATLPLLLYFGFRRYLQGMNLVKPVTFALISANVINLVGNWILIYGHWGAPAMGVEGSGWSTCWARVYMAAALLAAIVYYDRRDRTGLWQISFLPDLKKIWALVRLGFPAAAQLTLVVGVFATATALIAKLDPVSLAGHQIALNAASFSYMMPLGVSSAAAVRVGQALGRRDVPAADRAGWTALVLGVGFMSVAALAFLLVPRLIARIFTADPAVIRSGVRLLFVAAFFQLFDGLQVVATGALRGAGDTATPMICNLLAYWLLGLPAGYFLCFRLGWGATGIWIGLCASLILIGSVLLLVWHRKVQALSREVAPV
jgi:MATE family multidrug resistance protein